MAKVLITGGSSFLGGYLVKQFHRNHTVLATYCQNRPDANLPDVLWHPMDLTQERQIREVVSSFGPDLILHNAAMTNVDQCETQPEEATRLNVHGTEILVREARRTGAKVIYISTDLVFDGEHPPYAEEAQPNPLSHYGRTKAEAEHIVLKASQENLVVRPAIIYGPPVLLGTSFSEWMRHTWHKGQVTPLFEDQYRTPIFAGNLAEAIEEAVRKNLCGILHLGGADRVSRYEFGLYLAGVLNVAPKLLKRFSFRRADFTGRRPADVSLDIGRARAVLSTPLLGYREGIKQAYRAFAP